MARRSAAGSGSIRKKVVKRNGKEYVYWEARYTEGTDPGTGKQIQRSVTGKTQKEVSQKLKAATASIDSGTYTSPNKMNLGQWLDIWASEYLGGVKPFTVASYRGLIKNHIKPNLGAIRLDRLDAHTIQGFYNSLSRPQGEIARDFPQNDQKRTRCAAHCPEAGRPERLSPLQSHRRLQTAQDPAPGTQTVG